MWPALALPLPQPRFQLGRSIRDYRTPGTQIPQTHTNKTWSPSAQGCGAYCGPHLELLPVASVQALLPATHRWRPGPGHCLCANALGDAACAAGSGAWELCAVSPLWPAVQQVPGSQGTHRDFSVPGSQRDVSDCCVVGSQTSKPSLRAGGICPGQDPLENTAQALPCSAGWVSPLAYRGPAPAVHTWKAPTPPASGGAHWQPQIPCPPAPASAPPGRRNGRCIVGKTGQHEALLPPQTWLLQSVFRLSTAQGSQPGTSCPLPPSFLPAHHLTPGSLERQGGLPGCPIPQSSCPGNPACGWVGTPRAHSSP